MSWKFASSSRSSSSRSASSRMTVQLDSMCATHGKRSSGKNVASPTSERLPMKRSIGARTRSPSAIVHWTTRSQVDFDMQTHPQFVRAAASRRPRSHPSECSRGCRYDGHVVAGEMLVGRHDRQALATRLGDEEPIEGVAVVERQLGDTETLLWRKAKNLCATLEHMLAQAGRHPPLACRHLDADLDERDDAHQQLVGCLDRLHRTADAIQAPLLLPDEDVRVEQQSHRSLSSSSHSAYISSSSCSLSSKSS